MEGGGELMLRNILNVVRYGLCGSILGIALVEGFFPGYDLGNLIPGAAGFALAGGASAKFLAVI